MSIERSKAKKIKAPAARIKVQEYADEEVEEKSSSQELYEALQKKYSKKKRMLKYVPDESELVHVENVKVPRQVGGSASKGVLFLNKKSDELPHNKDPWAKQVGRDRKTERAEIGISESMFMSPEFTKKKLGLVSGSIKKAEEKSGVIDELKSKMRKQQAVLEYLRDVDIQSVRIGVHNFTAGQTKTIELMRGDVERTQKEIQKTFDLAVADSSFKLDRATINDIKEILETGEYYLKQKRDQEHMAIALRKDPRVKAMKQQQQYQAIESYMTQEEPQQTPYQRFQRHNRSLDVIRNDRTESLSQQVSGKRNSRIEALPSLGE